MQGRRNLRNIGLNLLYLHITALCTACPLYTVMNTASLLNILPQEYIVSRLSGRSLQVVFSGSLFSRSD
jgi:hypothetical protein